MQFSEILNQIREEAAYRKLNKLIDNCINEIQTAFVAGRISLSKYLLFNRLLATIVDNG